MTDFDRRMDSLPLPLPRTACVMRAEYSKGFIQLGCPPCVHASILQDQSARLRAGPAAAGVPASGEGLYGVAPSQYGADAPSSLDAIAMDSYTRAGPHAEGIGHVRHSSLSSAGGAASRSGWRGAGVSTISGAALANSADAVSKPTLITASWRRGSLAHLLDPDTGLPSIALAAAAAEADALEQQWAREQRQRDGSSTGLRPNIKGGDASLPRGANAGSLHRVDKFGRGTGSKPSVATLHTKVSSL